MEFLYAEFGVVAEEAGSQWPINALRSLGHATIFGRKYSEIDRLRQARCSGRLRKGETWCLCRFVSLCCLVMQHGASAGGFQEVL